jgi:hypothetical protein
MKRIGIIAAAIGVTLLAVWVAVAIATTPPAADSDAAYWACMERYGFSRDEPVTSGTDVERLGEADEACTG